MVSCRHFWARVAPNCCTVVEFEAPTPIDLRQEHPPSQFGNSLTLWSLQPLYFASVSHFGASDPSILRHVNTLELPSPQFFDGVALCILQALNFAALPHMELTVPL